MHSDLSDNLRRSKIPKLDFLRAVSALIVMLYHFGFTLVAAGTGVIIFFVISGFLITWLLLEEYEKTSTISLGHFYFRRSFRIFPAFYVFWALTVGGLLVRHRHVLWGQAVAVFFYVGNYYQGLNHYPENGFSHAWSLGVEEQYYLVWPAVVLLLARSRLLLLRVTCCAILAVWIYRDVLQLIGVREEYIYTAFDTRIDHLLVGCVLAISLRYGYFARFWKMVCARPWFMLFPLCGLVLSTIGAWIGGNSYRNTIGFTVDPVLVAVLLTQLLASRHRWIEWMDSGPLVYLGTISYSTYLYHEMAAGIAAKAFGEMPPGVLMVGGVAATYGIASISYYAIERPFLRLRARIDRRYRSA
jgi:peptidoglycan/LPS O-acetylase OafA/YrhL